MKFDDGLGWGIVGLVIVVIVALCSLAIRQNHKKRGYVLKKLTVAVIFGGLAYGVLSMLSGVGSANLHQQTRTTVYEAERAITELLGFTPGKPYDLVLGSKGSYSNTYYSLISGAHPDSGSTVTVSFTHGEYTDWIELPATTGQLRFIQDDNAKPTVTIWLTDINAGHWELPKIDMQSVETYAPCHNEMVNFFLNCVSGERLSRDVSVIPLNTEKQQAGLAPWISQYYVRAEIVLTHDMYDQMIGRIEQEQ